MTAPFLITGLPRSRTAWFATLCNTQPDTICFHEPVSKSQTWQDSLHVWNSPHRFVGISDSSLGFHLPEILESYAPRTLIVRRDEHAVVASLIAQGIIAQNFCALLQGRLSVSLNHPLVMTVEYDDLSDPEVVVSCLQWLMPDAFVDRDKIAELCRMNVQADMKAVKRDAIGRNIEDILGADIAAELRAM